MRRQHFGPPVQFDAGIHGPCEQGSGNVRVDPGLKVRKCTGLRKRGKIRSIKRRNLISLSATMVPGTVAPRYNEVLRYQKKCLL